MLAAVWMMYQSTMARKQVHFDFNSIYLQVVSCQCHSVQYHNIRHRQVTSSLLTAYRDWTSFVMYTMNSGGGQVSACAVQTCLRLTWNHSSQPSIFCEEAYFLYIFRKSQAPIRFCLQRKERTKKNHLIFLYVLVNPAHSWFRESNMAYSQIPPPYSEWIQKILCAKESYGYPPPPPKNPL